MNWIKHKNGFSIIESLMTILFAGAVTMGAVEYRKGRLSKNIQSSVNVNSEIGKVVLSLNKVLERKSGCEQFIEGKQVGQAISEIADTANDTLSFKACESDSSEGCSQNYKGLFHISEMRLGVSSVSERPILEVVFNVPGKVKGQKSFIIREVGIYKNASVSNSKINC